jgi:hypothetical protein
VKAVPTGLRIPASDMPVSIPASFPAPFAGIVKANRRLAKKKHNTMIVLGEIMFFICFPQMNIRYLFENDIYFRGIKKRVEQP